MEKQRRSWRAPLLLPPSHPLPPNLPPPQLRHVLPPYAKFRGFSFFYRGKVTLWLHDNNRTKGGTVRKRIPFSFFLLLLLYFYYYFFIFFFLFFFFIQLLTKVFAILRRARTPFVKETYHTFSLII